VASSIVGDIRYPNGIRRRALVVLLTVAQAERTNTRDNPATAIKLAELLGELQSYAALAPLEKLFESDDPTIRRAAVKALRYLYFKRSFVLVRKALVDSDEAVRAAAVVAIGGLHFPHAFNPLARLFRESTDTRVQRACLESIGKIASIEAAEFLVGVLRQSEGAMRDAAFAALRTVDNADALPILRQYAEVENNPAVRDMLAALVRRYA
jgi:HEAT repeat protein